jgi:tetratricopeptide (TPR) repeat protein
LKLKGRKQERELSAAIDRGRVLFSGQDSRDAREFLRDAARRFPDCAEFPLLLSSLFRESRPEEVEPLLAKAVELGSEDPTIQVRAGHSYLNEGDVEAARACATRTEILADDEFILRADLECLIGLIAARDGDYSLAEEKLRSALWREPEYNSHWLHLARFLWARARNEEALAVIDEALGRVGDIRDKKNLDRVRLEIINEGRL